MNSNDSDEGLGQVLGDFLIFTWHFTTDVLMGIYYFAEGLWQDRRRIRTEPGRMLGATIGLTGIVGALLWLAVRSLMDIIHGDPFFALTIFIVWNGMLLTFYVIDKWIGKHQSD